MKNFVTSNDSRKVVLYRSTSTGDKYDTEKPSGLELMKQFGGGKSKSASPLKRRFSDVGESAHVDLGDGRMSITSEDSHVEEGAWDTVDRRRRRSMDRHSDSEFDLDELTRGRPRKRPFYPQSHLLA